MNEMCSLVYRQYGDGVRGGQREGEEVLIILKVFFFFFFLKSDSSAMVMVLGRNK